MKYQDEVLTMVAWGYTNQQIAKALGRTEMGIRNQVRVLLKKYGVADKLELAMLRWNKRHILILVTVLLCGQICLSTTFGTPVANAQSGSATSITCSLTGVSSGDLIDVFSYYNHSGSTTTSVSDGSSTFTNETEVSYDSTSHFARHSYALSSATSGSVTYTITWGASVTFSGCLAVNATFSGTAAFDVAASGSSNGGTTSLSTGNITTTGTNEVAIAGCFEDNFGTLSAQQIDAVSSTMTKDDSQPLGHIFGNIFAATFTGNATATGSVNLWMCRLLTFKISGGGGSTPQQCIIGSGLCG